MGIPSNSKIVAIIHSRKHTCVAVPGQNFSKLETVLTENPDLCPALAACKCSWEEAIEITDTLIHQQQKICSRKFVMIYILKQEYMLRLWEN